MPSVISRDYLLSWIAEWLNYSCFLFISDTSHQQNLHCLVCIVASPHWTTHQQLAVKPEIQKGELFVPDYRTLCLIISNYSLQSSWCRWQSSSLPVFCMFPDLRALLIWWLENGVDGVKLFYYGQGKQRYKYNKDLLHFVKRYLEGVH